jgi:hypothetical protein
MRRRLGRFAFGVAAVTSITALAPPTASADDVATALSSLASGTAYGTFRLRTEHVEQDTRAKNAIAHTARTRLGYASGGWRDISFQIELENTTAIGAERFNDGTDPPGRRPTIPDPDSTEINLAVLRDEGLAATELILGRRRIVLDNERFIADAAFRQNQQTFDGGSIVNRSLPLTELRYDYVSGVQRPARRTQTGPAGAARAPYRRAYADPVERPRRQQRAGVLRRSRPPWPRRHPLQTRRFRVPLGPIGSVAEGEVSPTPSSNGCRPAYRRVSFWPAAPA